MERRLLRDRCGPRSEGRRKFVSDMAVGVWKWANLGIGLALVVL